MMRRMPPTNVRPLIDRIMDGTLDEWLRSHTDLSLQKLAAALEAEWDITVSPSTIGRWREALEGEGTDG